MPQSTAKRASLTPAEFLDLVRASIRALEVNRERINALNVFPVPDGDTGTNMFLTMRSVFEEMDSAPAEDMPRTTARMARAALLGARGNSGLILAQFFRGMSQALHEEHELNYRGIAEGLRLTSENAYAAVPNPREGTMLTVFRECAEAAGDMVAEAPDFKTVLEAVAERALDTTRRTPEMLDVLRDAGVVDSGGYGFTVMLYGALQALRGEGDGALVVEPPAVEGQTGALAAPISQEFLESVQEEIWGYCTVFAIEGDGFDPVAVRTQIMEMGRSAVVAGDETLVKVHVHMEDPGAALTFACSIGVISNIEIKNMDEQTKDWAAERQQEADALAPTETIPLAVVAVVAGDGMQELFLNAGLGTCSVIAGGDSMNPSVRELVDAVERAPSKNVLLLPNNKNVIGTAREVPGLTDKNVRVAGTASMQHGLAAMLAFMPDSGLDDNAEAMSEAAEEVTDGAVFRATRDVTIGGVDVFEGQYTGLVDGEVRLCGEDLAEVLIEAVKSGADDAEIVTVYRGADVDAAQAEDICARLEEAIPDAEVEQVDGGQPHYEFLFSIE